MLTKGIKENGDEYDEEKEDDSIYDAFYEKLDSD